MKRKRRRINKKAKKRASGDSCVGILCAGFGGQGIMFMGKLLAQAGLMAGKHVTWMPSYGAEVRGGTAYSMTKISNKEIANPITTRPDALIIMNAPSLMKYEDRLTTGGLLIYNKSLIDHPPKRKDIVSIGIPMTVIASKLGNTRCANMIALGSLLKRSKLLLMKDVLGALEYMFKDKNSIFLVNKKALERGYRG